MLRRAEWLKFLGLFFNMDAEASETFSSINESYYQTKVDAEVNTSSLMGHPDSCIPGPFFLSWDHNIRPVTLLQDIGVLSGRKLSEG